MTTIVLDDKPYITDKERTRIHRLLDEQPANPSLAFVGMKFDDKPPGDQHKVIPPPAAYVKLIHNTDGTYSPPDEITWHFRTEGQMQLNGCLIAPGFCKGMWFIRCRGYETEPWRFPYVPGDTLTLWFIPTETILIPPGHPMENELGNSSG